MFVDGTYGWDLPDPSKPPTLAWNDSLLQNNGPWLCGAYDPDDKLVLMRSFNDGFIRAVDALTGNIVWTAPVTTSTVFGDSYYNGMFIQGGLDNNMRAWNATTGELLWTYNPNTFYGQWGTATGVAYGMVYEHNQDTYLYAINATNGELVWKQKGPGLAYSNCLSIAGGKVYCMMGENQYKDPATGQSGYSEYDCFDAYTGELIWSLPLENGAPHNYECIAYGNLYLVPTTTPKDEAGYYYTYGYGAIGEVWCISSSVKDWSMLGADPAHSAEGAGPTDLTLKWSFPTGAQITSSPTIVEGVCYVGSLDNNIYAINADTGNKIWAFTTGFQVASSVAVVNGKVYTGADDGNVYCLDAATGTQRWKTFAGGVTHSNLGYVEPPLRCSPIVVGNNVYVGALDGNLYCFDATTGNVRWSLQTPGPIFATPAYADNAVYLASSTDGVLFGASQHGDFYKLDANTGSIIWHIEIPYSNTNPPFGKFLMASPTVADDLIFLRNDFSYTYAINATTGEIVWTFTGTGNPLSSVQSIQEGGVAQLDAPLYKYGVVYVNNFYGISAINATDGSSMWFTYLSREDISQGISYSYGRIYVVTMLGVLYVLDANTGAKLSYHEFGYQLQSMPSLYNGYVYLGCNDWNVYCFGDARLMSEQTQPTPTPISPASTPAASPTPTQTSKPSATVAPSPTPSPSPVQTAAPVTQQQTETPPVTASPIVASQTETPTLVYAVIAAVVIIVVIAVAALLIRKRK